MDVNNSKPTDELPLPLPANVLVTIKEIKPFGNHVPQKRRRLKDRAIEQFREHFGLRKPGCGFSLKDISRASRSRNRVDYVWRHHSIFDHLEFFIHERKPFAVISHTYDVDIPLSGIQAKLPDNVVVVELEESWYYPARARALLFLRPDGLEVFGIYGHHAVQRLNDWNALPDCLR